MLCIQKTLLFVDGFFQKLFGTTQKKSAQAFFFN